MEEWRAVVSGLGRLFSVPPLSLRMLSCQRSVRGGDPGFLPESMLFRVDRPLTNHMLCDEMTLVNYFIPTTSSTPSSKTLRHRPRASTSIRCTRRLGKTRCRSDSAGSELARKLRSIHSWRQDCRPILVG